MYDDIIFSPDPRQPYTRQPYIGKGVNKMLWYYTSITNNIMVGSKDHKELTGGPRKKVSNAILNAIQDGIHHEMRIYDKVRPVLDKYCNASLPHLTVFEYVLKWLQAKGKVFCIDLEYHVPKTKMEKALAERLTTYIDYCKHHHKHGEVVEN